MLKNKAEFNLFIRLLFSSSEIEINGMPADKKDLIALCERVSVGKENVRNRYVCDGHTDKLYVTTI